MSIQSLFSKITLKSTLKGLKITALITLIGGTSLMCTQFFLANELDTVAKVPTTYDVSKLAYSVNRQIPTGYVKANYSAICAPHSESIAPQSKDLSLQDAAEIVAQQIFKFSGEDLNNHTLEMSYYPGITDISQNDTSASSIWVANVSIAPSYHYLVNIVASTGELLYIQCTGTPNMDKPFNIDEPSTAKLMNERLNSSIKEIKNNLDDTCKKAQNLITKKGYLAEPIQSIAYVYTRSDAYGVVFHAFKVTTDSNKIYRFSLSEDLTQLRSCFMGTNLSIG